MSTICMTDFLADSVLRGGVKASSSARRRPFDRKEQYATYLRYAPVVLIAELGVIDGEIARRGRAALDAGELKLPPKPLILEFGVDGSDELPTHQFVVEVSHIKGPNCNRLEVEPYVALGAEASLLSVWRSGFGIGLIDPAEPNGIGITLSDLEADEASRNEHDQFVCISAQAALTVLWGLQNRLFDVSYAVRRASPRVETHVKRLQKQNRLPPPPANYPVLRLCSSSAGRC